MSVANLIEGLRSHVESCDSAASAFPLGSYRELLDTPSKKPDPDALIVLRPVLECVLKTQPTSKVNQLPLKTAIKALVTSDIAIGDYETFAVVAAAGLRTALGHLRRIKGSSRRLHQATRLLSTEGTNNLMSLLELVGGCEWGPPEDSQTLGDVEQDAESDSGDPLNQGWNGASLFAEQQSVSRCLMKRPAAVDLEENVTPQKRRGTTQIDDETPASKPEVATCRKALPGAFTTGFGVIHLSLGENRSEITATIKGKRVFITTISSSATLSHRELAASATRFACLNHEVTLEDMRSIVKDRIVELKKV